jgi:FkbM family methyltransferase
VFGKLYLFVVQNLRNFENIRATVMFQRDLVFDIGMFDGADTAYYLDKGFRVVSVEANKDLVSQAEKKFGKYLDSKKLIIENLAIADSRGTVDLYFTAEDLGSSSTQWEWVENRKPNGKVQVNCAPLSDLFDRYGIPYYLKSDIEGLDRLCVLSLSQKIKPAYVSFEMGDDTMELLEYLGKIGYRNFKVINQATFYEVSNLYSITHRIRRRFRKLLNHPGPEYVTHHGYRFKRGHSSGPMAEETDGSWSSLDQIKTKWQSFCQRYSKEQRCGWFDLHARSD